MAKNQSEASPFKSRFSGPEENWLTPAQYLAENMVARQAKKDGTDLPIKFWEIERWKRIFLLQVRHATSLLKLYDINAIIKALRSKRGKNIYSLGAKFIDPLIRVEQERLDRHEEVIELKSQNDPKPVEPPSDEPKELKAPRPAFVQNTTLSKLKDL